MKQRILTLLLTLLSLGTSKMWAAEAYVAVDTNNRTITFYYDNLRSTRGPLTFPMETGNYTPGWTQGWAYDFDEA